MDVFVTIVWLSGFLVGVGATVVGAAAAVYFFGGDL